jgi:predicted permease
MLVIAAGLFVRTFMTLANRDLGFKSDPILVVSIDAQPSKADETRRPALFERVTAAVAAQPGVAMAAASAITPVSGMMWNDLFEFPELTLSQRDRIVNQNFVTPGWFALYATPFVAGRDFDDRDRAGGVKVAIVNEAFVRKYIKDGNALGRTVKQVSRPDRPSAPLQIVGIVKDAVYRSVREPVAPAMYRPIAQADQFPPFMSVSVRAASGSPAALTRSIAAAIQGVDRDLSLAFRPLKAQIDGALAQERVVAILSGFFGVLALLLAGIGLYGVTSYAVSRRRTEIGIRMALGADAAGVVRLVLRRVALLVVVGVIIGAGISLWAAKFVGTLLYNLEPRDPLTIAGAGAVLAMTGALAGWLPARRASRIDPAEVLRQG